MKKKKLNDLIREVAAKNECNNDLHHEICKKLVELSDRYDFPMGVLVYIAVGTSAHKSKVFEKGYSKINEQKAIAVISICKLFANKFGTDFRKNDKVVHMFSRYYDIGGSKNKLRHIIDNANIDMSKQKFDTTKVLSKLLFGDNAEFSKSGYIIGIK